MAVEAATPTAQTIPTAPLCTDLDGTLIRSDLLLESLMLLIKRNPLYVFLIPVWLFRARQR